jgi:hypothetical protein
MDAVMGSPEGTILIVLAVLAVLAAVLLDIAWTYGLRRIRPKPDTQEPAPMETPPAGGWRVRIGNALHEWAGRNPRWSGMEQSLRHWAKPAALILIVLLAAVPSAVVMADRWFNLGWTRTLLSNARGISSFWASFPLPTYFLLFFIVLAAAGALMSFFPPALQVFANPAAEPPPAEDRIPKVQFHFANLFRWLALTEFITVAVFSGIYRRLPGAELAVVALFFVAGWLMRDYSLASMGKSLQENWYWLFPCVLVHVALLGVVTAYHSSAGSLPDAVAGLILALIYLFPRRRRIPGIYWIFSLGLILFSINVNAWWMSVAGDEYGFYVSAVNIADGTNLWAVLSRLFDLKGVYGQNPYFSSVVQAVFLKLFGTQGFGWRFSNIYLCALSIPLFYYFLKAFLDRRIALLAGFFLAVSEYVINFSKIGYANLQALFLLAASLAAAAWAVRSRRTAEFAVCGAVWAVNFYVYHIALVAWPLALLLLLLFAPPFSRAAAWCWANLLAGFGILIFPLFFQPDFWKTDFQFTVFNSGIQPRSIGAFPYYAYRTITSWFSYLYSPNESHFVSVSFVDGITAALIAIGFFAVLYRLRRSRFAVFFLAGWILLTAAAGILGSPEQPSATRMFVVLPWWCAAAAFGLWWIREQIQSLGALGRKNAGFWAGGILAAAAAVNLVHASVISRTRWLDRQSYEASVERVAEEMQGGDRFAQREFVFITSADYSIAPFLLFREVYPQYWADLELQKVGVSGPVLPLSLLAVEKNPGSVIFVMPALPKEWRDGIRTSLLAAGYRQCAVYSPTGKQQTEIYVARDMAWVCLKLK